MNKTRILLLLAVLLAALIPTGSASSAAPSSYDLIAAVNDLRSANGLPDIDTDNALMSAAQTQSDYLADIYDANYPSWEQGHIGADGSYARERAVAAGYNLASGMNVVENWAGGNSSTTLTEVITSFWGDEAHMVNMLHPDAVAVGAGISEGESGSLYFILNVGVQYGSGDSASTTDSGVYSTVPTTAVTAAVAFVQVTTPQADGRLTHIVDAGQALWNIAAAYDVTVEQLLDLNNISDDIITVGQEILIQVAYTPTPSPTATITPRPPTRTPVPAQTAQAVEAPEENSEDGDDNGFLGMSRQTMGLVLILICGAGLALIVIGNMNKNKSKNKEKDRDDDLPGPDFEI